MGLLESLDPKQRAKLLALGNISSEQEESIRRDNRAREEKENKEREKKQRAQEKNYGNQGRKRQNERYHTQSDYNGPSRHIYGEVLDLPPAALPPMIATAPYNFVPLPKAVMVSPLQAYLDKGSKLAAEGEDETAAAFRTYMAEKANLKGHIDLEIETVTPVYIGGEKGKFFAPGGKPIIPGSSLRGMVRNLYKIVTCGSWKKDEDIKDTHLYYRCLMAPNDTMPFLKELNEKYSDYMTSTEEGHVKKNARPGFLVKLGNKWLIYPLLPDKLRSIPIWKYIKIFNLKDEHDERDQYRKIRRSSVRWEGKTAYIQIGMLSTDLLKFSQEDLEKATKEERASWGKQYYKYMSLDDLDKSKCYPVPDLVIESYQGDKNRRGVNLIREVSRKNFIISGKKCSIAPCFFFLDDAGQVKSFGHGQSYRIPYDNSIMDVVPPEVRDSQAVDFANAVFGMSRRDVSWASRVSFDDAVPVGKIDTLTADEAHMLMQPNPTAFQLYLKQNRKDQLVHWDSENPKAEVRGYKLYWHSSADHNWHATAKELELSRKNVSYGKAPLTKKIEPLAPGSKFRSTIHFHDLTEEELGALLLIFRLGKGSEDIVYKIGMGKSIGLGSIRIKATLFREDGSRYKTLFDNEGWHKSRQKEEPDKYIEAYEKLVRENPDGELAQSYREAVENLSLMLDYNHTKLPGWEKATMQMDGDTQNHHRVDKRFDKRNILPEAAAVVDKVKNRKA